jgi:hypothetical protein
MAEVTRQYPQGVTMPKFSRLGRVFNQFDANNKRIAAIAAGGGPLAQLAAKYDNIIKLEQQVRDVHVRVAEKLRPAIKAALDDKYQQSGLGHFTNDEQYKPTGKLYSACVTNAQIEATEKGLTIGMAPGQDPKLYIRAGALEYGAVHNSGVSRGKRNKIKRHSASIYNATGQRKLGGTDYYPPHPFFRIDSAMSSLQALYVQYFQAEVNRIIGPAERNE